MLSLETAFPATMATAEIVDADVLNAASRDILLPCEPKRERYRNPRRTAQHNHPNIIMPIDMPLAKLKGALKPDHLPLHPQPGQHVQHYVGPFQPKEAGMCITHVPSTRFHLGSSKPAGAPA